MLTGLAPSPADRWFEDDKPGAVHEYGYAARTGDELLDFARRRS